VAVMMPMPVPMPMVVPLVMPVIVVVMIVAMMVVMGPFDRGAVAGAAAYGAHQFTSSSLIRSSSPVCNCS
jgi:hypothetical protein